MQEWKLVAWWMSVVAYVALVWVIELFSFEDLSSPTAAAWVQAVGSVLAILAAVAVAAFQHSRDVLREERKEREERRRVVGVLHRCASELCSVINSQGIIERSVRRFEDRALDSMFLRLDLLTRALNSFVPSQMPTPELHVLLHNLLLRVADLIDSTRANIEKHQSSGFYVVNWASHWDHHFRTASELEERLEFQLTLIDDPGAAPPW